MLRKRADSLARHCPAQHPLCGNSFARMLKDTSGIRTNARRPAHDTAQRAARSACISFRGTRGLSFDVPDRTEFRHFFGNTGTIDGLDDVRNILVRKPGFFRQARH